VPQYPRQFRKAPFEGAFHSCRINSSKPYGFVHAPESDVARHASKISEARPFDLASSDNQFFIIEITHAVASGSDVDCHVMQGATNQMMHADR
jgi:hypothetical protein